MNLLSCFWKAYGTPGNLLSCFWKAYGTPGLAFFLERKKPILVILKKNQRSSIHSPLKRVTYHQHPKSTAEGKGITTKMCDPIRKLSHHKERTVFTSTSIECQKALISNLKVITLSIITNIRDM